MEAVERCAVQVRPIAAIVVSISLPIPTTVAPVDSVVLLETFVPMANVWCRLHNPWISGLLRTTPALPI